MLRNAFSDYFRCPDDVAGTLQAEPSGHAGFFQFGNAICYGRCTGSTEPKLDGHGLYDALASTYVARNRVSLPFDPTEVINNLRLERYVPARRIFPHPLAHRAYYHVRRLIPMQLRWRLQRLAYSGWESVRFPSWPVDTTVENIVEILWILVLEATGASKLPFIWFWPDGYAGTAIVTHDVETVRGLEFCSTLMDIDDHFGLKSSFQLIPQQAYRSSVKQREEMQRRGFEVNVHDLRHDGWLFADRGTFLCQVREVNRYASEFGALGFRSGMMYRNPDWYDALNFSYDMSIPNVAHLEPQQGGCCTVMPYFVGSVLELPLTITQDFALFHLLRDYSTDLWEKQLSIVLHRHGLASFIVHPDYLGQTAAQRVYKTLLTHLSTLRSDGILWLALPKSVHDWWVQRSRMHLVMTPSGWKIEGPGSDRASIAYATLNRGRLYYELNGRLHRATDHNSYGNTVVTQPPDERLARPAISGK